MPMYGLILNIFSLVVLIILYIYNLFCLIFNQLQGFALLVSLYYLNISDLLLLNFLHVKYKYINSIMRKRM